MYRIGKVDTGKDNFMKRKCLTRLETYTLHLMDMVEAVVRLTIFVFHTCQKNQTRETGYSVVAKT
jgi:hypothetical protein